MNNLEVRILSGRPRKIEVHHDFLENEELTIYEIMTYITLKKYVNESSQCYPSIETIAKGARASVTTTKKAIKGLIEKGYLIVEKRIDKEKGQLPNLYTVLDYSPSEIKEILKSRQEQKNTPANNHESRGNTTNNSIYDNTTTTEEKSQTKNIEVDENIVKVREIVGEKLSEEEIKTVLQDANNSIEVIKEKHDNIVKNYKGSINNLVGLLRSAIRNDYKVTQSEPTRTAYNAPNRSNKALNTYKPNKNTNHATKASNNRFNDFPQRNYTKDYYSNLEQALLNRQ